MDLQAKVKGLFTLSLSLGLLLLGAAIWARFTALPDLATLLPKDDTESFFILKKELAPSSPYADLTWVDLVGSAQVGENTVSILQINSSQAAEEYLTNLRAEGETITTTKATAALWSKVYCYPASQNPCYTWLGQLLLLSEDKNTLLRIQRVIAGEEENLKANANFQNIKSRLARWQAGFIYLNLEKILPRYATDFPSFGALLELYPAFGTTLKATASSTFSVESFLAVKKSLLQNQAYSISSQKMTAQLWSWAPDDLAIEWSGMNSGQQLLAMQNHLQILNQDAATLFENELQTRLATLFGPDLVFADLVPLLTGEQYFGFTPGSDFLLLTHFDSEEEIEQALELKDRFAAHYLFPKPVQMPNGETQLVFTPLTQRTAKYQGYQYYDFTAEDQSVLTAIFTENTAILASTQSLAFATLDRMKGRAPLRPMDTVDRLLPGSNEIFSVHCLLLPNGSILKALLSSVDSFTLARKLFDDGSFARSELKLSTP